MVSNIMTPLVNYYWARCRIHNVSSIQCWFFVMLFYLKNYLSLVSMFYLIINIEQRMGLYFIRRSPAKHKKKSAAIHRSTTINPLYTSGFVTDSPLTNIFRT